MSNWRDDEIRKLLSVRADAQIVGQIRGTAKDSVVYDRMTNLLRDRGVVRTRAQVHNKLKALKRQYHQVVDHNDRKSWTYFDLCETVWGSSHSTNPVALVGSMETVSASSRNPDSGSTETPYSDTEEQTETDASISEPACNAESSCRSPKKKKRRRWNQTRSEKLCAAMRDLFSEMDADFAEQERLRLQEQREYEERVRRETRAEKAQEIAVLRDMVNILRQMVQRMPAGQTQPSLNGTRLLEPGPTLPP